MNPLGYILQNRLSVKNTRQSGQDNLCQPVPGHPELAANKLAQVWNLMNLSTAKTLGQVKAFACDWYKKNAKILE